MCEAFAWLNAFAPLLVLSMVKCYLVSLAQQLCITHSTLQKPWTISSGCHGIVYTWLMNLLPVGDLDIHCGASELSNLATALLVCCGKEECRAIF